MKLIELFPWSAQARIIDFLIEKRMEGEDYYFANDIHKGGEISHRTVQTMMPQLIAMKIVEKKKQKAKSNVSQWGYRLTQSSVALALIKLESALHD